MGGVGVGGQDQEVVVARDLYGNDGDHNVPAVANPVAKIVGRERERLDCRKVGPPDAHRPEHGVRNDWTDLRPFPESEFRCDRPHRRVGVSNEAPDMDVKLILSPKEAGVDSERNPAPVEFFPSGPSRNDRARHAASK